MSSTFPPLAALFLTHFDDLKGQEVVYYTSVSDSLPPNVIEHTTLPSGLHLRNDDLVAFSHHGLPGVGIFRSRDKDTGRGRRMGTIGVVLASPSTSDAVFELAGPLEALYDRLEGMENPFAAEGGDKEAVKALLDTVWKEAKAPGLQPPQTPSAKTVAVRLSRGVSPSNPITYLPALLSMLGPAIVTVYKASLSGQRILLYAPPPLLPLAAFAWCIWAMGLPPAGAVTAGARVSTWLGQVGLMDLTDVKTRQGGWVATTSDLVFKSHADAYDLMIDFSTSIPTEEGSDVRTLTAPTPVPQLIVSRPANGGRPTTATVTYAFGDLALYRSLVLLDQSPHSVHAETVGFSATSRTGGMWLLMFEMLERIWHLCVGVCEFALGRGRVGGPINLEDGDEDAHLLNANLTDIANEDDDDDDEPLPDGTAVSIPDESARRGRLILDQLHHNAHHLYARLIGTAAGTWELSDSNLRTLSGSSRLTWGGRESADSKFWLALARTWNVEPTVAADGPSD